MRAHRWLLCGAMLVVLGGAAGCAADVSLGAHRSSGISARGPSPAPSQVTSGTSLHLAKLAPGTALVAEPTGAAVDIYTSSHKAQPSLVMSNPWLLNGVSSQPIPQAMLVLRTTGDGWTEVQLPVRPNGSSGWLAPGTARLLVDHYRIEVTLHLHRITVLRDGASIYTGAVATGAPATPTPVGLFYIRVLLHTTDPTSVYGPYAYGLSAHSEALTTFDGGDAEIGIHGNNDASVLGESITHGCVRMDNAEISRLAGVLPLGTPVTVRA